MNDTNFNDSALFDFPDVIRLLVILKKCYSLFYMHSFFQLLCVGKMLFLAWCAKTSHCAKTASQPRAVPQGLVKIPWGWKICCFSPMQFGRFNPVCRYFLLPPSLNVHMYQLPVHRISFPEHTLNCSWKIQSQNSLNTHTVQSQTGPGQSFRAREYCQADWGLELLFWCL